MAHKPRIVMYNKVDALSEVNKYNTVCFGGCVPVVGPPTRLCTYLSLTHATITYHVSLTTQEEAAAWSEEVMQMMLEQEDAAKARAAGPSTLGSMAEENKEGRDEEDEDEERFMELAVAGSGMTGQGALGFDVYVCGCWCQYIHKTPRRSPHPKLQQTKQTKPQACWTCCGRWTRRCAPSWCTSRWCFPTPRPPRSARCVAVHGHGFVRSHASPPFNTTSPPHPDHQQIHDRGSCDKVVYQADGTFVAARVPHVRTRLLFVCIRRLYTAPNANHLRTPTH